MTEKLRELLSDLRIAELWRLKCQAAHDDENRRVEEAKARRNETWAILGKASERVVNLRTALLKALVEPEESKK